MAGTIYANCSTLKAHTGRTPCAKKEKRAIALILTNPGASYPLDPETFNNGVQGWIEGEGSNKIWPVTQVIEAAQTGGDGLTSTIGYGGTIYTGINPYSVIYQIKGDICLAKELLKFNGADMRLFRIDSDQFIFGTEFTQIRGGTDTSVFRGFDVNIGVWDLEANGTDDYRLYIGVSYSANYQNEKINMHGFKLDQLPEGLVGVRLQAVTGTAGAARVVGTCSGNDYTSEFGDEWTVGMFENAAGAAPTSVTYNADNGTIVFAPTGAAYRIRPANILSAAGIYGLDGLDETTEL